MDEDDEYLRDLFDDDQIELLEAVVADKRANALIVGAAMISGAVALFAANGFTREQIDDAVSAAVRASKRQHCH